MPLVTAHVPLAYKLADVLTHLVQNRDLTDAIADLVRLYPDADSTQLGDSVALMQLEAAK